MSNSAYIVKHVVIFEGADMLVMFDLIKYAKDHEFELTDLYSRAESVPVREVAA